MTMSTFIINTIVVCVSATVAFVFNLMLEFIKRKIDTVKARERNRRTVLMALRATKGILDAIKQRYNNNNFFDYIYIGQLENIAKKLDEFRTKESFMAKSSDQSGYFDTVSKIDLLIASMKSIQNYEYDKTLPDIGKDEFVKKTKTTLIVDLSSLSSSVESIMNKLEK
ncbi:MAG: hypothetical protein WCJ36_01515 [Candidatus Saccharibacteria bacterium]